MSDVEEHSHVIAGLTKRLEIRAAEDAKEKQRLAKMQAAMVNPKYNPIVQRVAGELRRLGLGDGRQFRPCFVVLLGSVRLANACSSHKRLFVNCTRNALVSMSVKLLPSRTVVLEILENITVDAELVRACKELKRSGFRLALDDFSPYDQKAELVELADYVKVDFRAFGPDARREIYELFRNRKVAFLAEKVETLADVRIAEAEGNTLFQGYFHSRPEIIAEAQISPIQSVYLQLFALLAKSPMDERKVEGLLLMEPSLCYRLLRVPKLPHHRE